MMIKYMSRKSHLGQISLEVPFVSVSLAPELASVNRHYISNITAMQRHCWYICDPWEHTCVSVEWR